MGSLPKLLTVFLMKALVAVTLVASVHVHAVVDSAVRPILTKDRIPGMGVGLIVEGKPYELYYGVRSLATNAPVSGDTLFELGSVTKTFTATLASLAEADGNLSLSNPVATYLPALAGHPFGSVSLINLGTHTPGGLPLQVPDDIHNDNDLMRYFERWRPVYPAGTYRTYSNVGIGLLGVITAQRFHQPFETLMERHLFPALGMNHSYVDVPASKMIDYAEGYGDAGPIRMKPGVLWAEAYGIRATVPDMLRFIEANMHLLPLRPSLQEAIEKTHTGYFTASTFVQDLIWEQYPYPVTLQTLQAGNAPDVIFNPKPATRLSPPQAPRDDVWINKTGSTNGFAAYVAFVPSRRCGIVILANKSYPIADRVTIAYTILHSVCHSS